MHEREAFRAIFSFGGTVESLSPDQVGGLDGAVKNARQFATEVVAMLKQQPATEGVTA
jgi:chromosome partitioning protein